MERSACGSERNSERAVVREMTVSIGVLLTSEAPSPEMGMLVNLSNTVMLCSNV